jgi:hypothetical protein
LIVNNVTAEQIQQAKEVDILAFLLANEPNNVKKVGCEYRLKDHDSFAVSNGKWHWHSRGIGGRNAIDYLVKVRGYGFVEAVQVLTGGVYAAALAPPPVKHKPFMLPPRNADNRRVIAYLQERGIALPLIQGCIKRGSLYEDTRHNCVFVGFDDVGKPRYAALRGTYGDFKGEVPGSDKRYGFLLPPMPRECQCHLPLLTARASWSFRRYSQPTFLTLFEPLASKNASISPLSPAVSVPWSRYS